MDNNLTFISNNISNSSIFKNVSFLDNTYDDLYDPSLIEREKYVICHSCL